MGKQSRGLLFTVVVVSLNPGEKLRKTIESVFRQDYREFEVILKDGGSEDGSVEAVLADYEGEPRLRVCRGADGGIYEAMNQALDWAEGDYVIFLNCGDSFYEEHVLSKVAAAVSRQVLAGQGALTVYYGDTYSERLAAVLYAPPSVTGFVCYRNIPCHQSCFYDTRLFHNRRYLTRYRVRADYEHFLWCFYRRRARMEKLDLVVASYEGGGYSEGRESRKRDAGEYRRITREYMGKGERLKYQVIMALTLAPLRSRIGESPVLSRIYQRAKRAFYRPGI
ncbi:MAG: glycosyltransferase [Clostridium sp.]|jgi:glycosyltransferase involved in cell wall biosynthesis|nr:glycosyltransferase [Clostridium sp.]